jgi:hypothetical protein
VRWVRLIECSLEGRKDSEAEAVRGYCQAVRSAITDDERTPLAASGLKLHDRLQVIEDSIERVGAKGGCLLELERLRRLVSYGLAQTACMWPPIQPSALAE